MKKLNKEKKCLLVTFIFIIIGAIAIIPVSAVQQLWGPTVGWFIGCLVTIISQFLLFRSGQIVQDQAKSDNKGMSLIVLFYLSRFLLYGLAFALCISMHYLVKNDIIDKLFNWSWITCIIPLLPSTLIIAIFYHDDDSDINKKDALK